MLGVPCVIILAAVITRGRRGLSRRAPQLNVFSSRRRGTPVSPNLTEHPRAFGVHTTRPFKPGSGFFLRCGLLFIIYCLWLCCFVTPPHQRLIVVPGDRFPSWLPCSADFKTCQPVSFPPPPDYFRSVSATFTGCRKQRFWCFRGLASPRGATTTDVHDGRQRFRYSSQRLRFCYFSPTVSTATTPPQQNAQVGHAHNLSRLS